MAHSLTHTCGQKHNWRKEKLNTRDDDGDENDDCDDNDNGDNDDDDNDDIDNDDDDNDDDDNDDVDNDDGGGERKMHFCDAAATSIVDSIPLWSEKREVNLH